jgi:hypothetical protein
VMEHLSDSKARKALDDFDVDFARDVRNVHIGLVTDGFSPYNTSVASSQSSGSSFVPRHSEDRLMIKMLKASLRQRDEEMRRWDEAMRQHDGFYTWAFAQ